MRSITACAVLIATAVWTLACSGSVATGPVVHEHHNVERGAATDARVEIDMSAGDLDVKPGAMTLFAGDFDFNVPDLKPAIAYMVDGSTGVLKVSQGSVSGNAENKWNLSLDETTPVDLRVTLGAGDAQLVLGRLNLQKLAIRLGAGDLMVDLRGMPSRSYSVNVEAGAGDTTIQLPASVGIFRRARPASLARPTSAASRSATDAGSMRGRKDRPSRSTCPCNTQSAI